MVEITLSSVKYEAGSVLLELATDVAESGRVSRPEIVSKIKKGYRISSWLQALEYSEFLTKDQIDRILYCLIQTAGIHDFPIAPNVTVPSSDVRIGAGNTVTVNNTYTNGTPFSNADVDTGEEVVDQFTSSDATGAVWFYTIRNTAGTIQRSGWITATWTSGGSLQYTPEDSTEDVGGTVDVSLSVDIDSGDVVLVATATSDNWQVYGRRFLITTS